MVRAMSAFLEFCYLIRRNTINEDTLIAIDAALARYHTERKIFEEVGVRDDNFSLPRQHSMVHYRALIQEFGAPNGLCSSITESKHIKAVKEPWRRSNRYNALGQMLVTNQRMDNIAASRVDFTDRGMLDAPVEVGLPEVPRHRIPDLDEDDDDDGGAIDVQKSRGGVRRAKRRGENMISCLSRIANSLHLNDHQYPLTPRILVHFRSSSTSLSFRP